MAIDILGVQPHKVSRDLKGYAVMFYGEPKSGKTTTATRFPKSLLLAFEKGYSAIPGVNAQPINSWSEFSQVLRQLDSDEAKERYDNIIVDTADIAYEYCEKYISNQNGVASIADIGFGKGYGLTEKEYDSKLRRIMQLGYGLVIISHSQDKTFTDEQGNEHNQITPTLDKRGSKIITRMSDIIGYSRSVENPEVPGETQTRLFMRGTPRFVAGSRFPTTPDSIVFNYKNLVGAISEAVDDLDEIYGEGSVTDEVSKANVTVTKLPQVEELIAQFNSLASELMEKDPKFYGERIKDVVEEVLGVGAKIGNATPKQAELVDLALGNLVDLAKRDKG